MPGALVVNLILWYKYPLIVILTIVEGPLIMMFSGFFVKLGLLSLIPTYFSLMVGDLCGDVAWYWIGYHFGHPFVGRFGRFFSITDKNVRTLEKFFHKHTNWILIINKVSMGFGFAIATLFTAGMTKIPFRRYFFLNFIGQFFWTALLMSVGYFLGNAFVSINNIFSRISIITGFFILLLLLFGLSKFIRAEVIKKFGS